MELLRIHNLTKIFPQYKITAVDNVSFSIIKGEILGIVGESGCGKTTLARLILRLLANDKGSVLYKGEDLLRLSNREMRKKRKELQIVFQDPYMSLDPQMRIGETIEEVFIIHNTSLTKIERKHKVNVILEMVGLSEVYINRFPSELSGGERQRVGIAHSLASEPEFVICDEPVSNLDISIQAQILNLLMDIQKRNGLTYLFISHDLAVISSICDRVIVMQKGRFVEEGLCEDIFSNPKDEWTKKLIECAR